MRTLLSISNDDMKVNNPMLSRVSLPVVPGQGRNYLSGGGMKLLDMSGYQILNFQQYSR